MKKILIYNWIPFDEKENKGGGVTVYTNNLVAEMCKDDSLKVFFLSSGRAYNLAKKETYIEKVDNIYGERCNSYQVVNSPVFSSARIMFPFLEDYLEDMTLYNVLKNFIVELGGIDVIHFQNLEGLSLNVLKLKEVFPQTKFIYSLHNYFLFCPQVTLWRNDKENCTVENCGSCCLDCMQRDIYKYKVKYNQYINYQLQKNNDAKISACAKIAQNLLECICKNYTKIFRKHYSQKEIRYFQRVFSEFRKKNVEYVNQYIDVILAVSYKVAEIATLKGVSSEKLSVSYIGSDVARVQKKETVYEYDGETFGISYLGYMKTMKGFYFLLEALEEMDIELAKKIRVIFAAKGTDNEALKRIEKLKDKFADVIWFDGYSRDTLESILENVQLGIVPVLWEDNLPQVAIEMKAYGIPVLTSDMGGASEISSSSEFVFKAGDKTDFLLKLQRFVSGEISLHTYWEDYIPICTMEEHLKELKGLYY